MLEPSVLSVFAQLLSTVMGAMHAGKAAVHLQSEDVQLNPTGACFTLLDSSLTVCIHVELHIKFMSVLAKIRFSQSFSCISGPFHNAVFP